jgi:exopolysaccharide biosynthesis protein
VYAVLNGGYFDMVNNISASFISSEGKVYHANNINKVPNSKIYPTIGTFGVLKNGSFSI